MSHDPSGIRLNYKYVAEKDEDEESGDRGEEVTDDEGEHFVPSLIRIPRNEEHDPSGIRLQCKHKEEDGGEQDGGGRFREPTLIRLSPAEKHGRENITFSDADDNDKKPAATADLSTVSDHDVSPRTVVRTLSEPVHRVQFPLADSPTGGHHSPGSAQLKSPPVLSALTNVAATVPPPTPPTGPNDNKDLMHVKASIRNRDKINAKMMSVPISNRVPFGPEFKDQTRPFNPIEAERIEDVKLRESSARGPTPEHQMQEEGDEEEIDTEAGDATSAGHGAVSNGTTRLVEAELVIPAEAEVIEEKPQRKAWLVVLAMVLTGAIVGGIVGSILSDRKDTATKSPIGTLQNATGTPNQKCEDAIKLEAGQETVNGTTLGALAGPKDSLCGTALDPEGAPAVWYSVTGTDEVLNAFTCADFDNQILVYNGTCGSLTCIDGNDYYDPSMICSSDFAAAVGWFAKAGTVYYIKVTGYSSSVGTFELGISIVPKQDCENTIMLEAGQETVKGSTLGALAGPKDSFCGTALDPEDAPAVWYSVTGTDEVLNAFTCADFDNQILVYNGTCGNLTCVDGNDYYISTSCSSYNAAVSWFAKAGMVYYIKVTGYSSIDYSTVGTFELGISSVTKQDCENAIMLEAGQETVKGSTLGVLAGPKDSFCGTASDHEGVPAVWYSVTGTDEDLTAFTCADFDSQILVYNGTCGSLTCIDGNNEYYSSTICSSYFAAAVGWFAKAGMVYYIKVTGYSSSVGTFELGIPFGKLQILYPLDPTDPPEPPPENDDCEGAEWVSHELTGSTSFAKPSGFLSDELSVCNGESLGSYHLSPDVWYQFNGTGEWHTATTCTGIDSLDSFDSYVAIYSGTCSNLTCITSNDNSFSSDCSPYNAIASWLTEEGETYLIRVSGTDEYVTGDFGIRIDDGKIELPPEPVNNYCETATLLELDQVVNGTTLGATPSLEMPSCDQGTYIPGQGRPDVWYHLLGTGDILTVTTCTNTSLDDSGFDTVLAVYSYTGNCTSEITCIDENDDDDRDSCDTNLSGVSWQSELNEEYYVQVYGFAPVTFGTFGIKAYKGTPDGKLPPDTDSTIPPSYG